MQVRNLTDRELNEIFALQVESVLDASVAKGRFGNGRYLIELSLEQDDLYEEAFNLTFSPELKIFDPEYLEIDLGFDWAGAVSSTMFGPDMLKVEVKNLTYFIIEATGLPLDASSYKGDPFKNLPLMSDDHEWHDAIKGLSEALKETVEGILVSNTAMAPFIGYSVTSIYGTIRAIQL